MGKHFATLFQNSQPSQEVRKLPKFMLLQTDGVIFQRLTLYTVNKGNENNPHKMSQNKWKNYK